MAHERHGGLDGRAGAFEDRFDASIRQVAHPARDAQLFGATSRSRRPSFTAVDIDL